MIIGFVVVAISSGLPNGLANIFGTKLYTQPSWLPVMEFPWWICFGTIVTFFVAILFRTGCEHRPGVLSGISKQVLTGRALLNYLRGQRQSFRGTLNHAIPCPTS